MNSFNKDLESTIFKTRLMDPEYGGVNSTIFISFNSL